MDIITFITLLINTKFLFKRKHLYLLQNIIKRLIIGKNLYIKDCLDKSYDLRNLQRADGWCESVTD